MLNNVTKWLDETCKRFPDKLAYADAQKGYTFSAIRHNAIQIAAKLVSLGLFKKPVALYMEKSCDMNLAMFAAAYSGNFYSPIDVTMPASRVEKIVSCLQPALILTKSALLADAKKMFAGQQHVLAIEDILQDDAVSFAENEASVLAQREKCCDTDLLYVLFTSGSTGIPKGVTICHQSVVDYIDFLVDAFHFDENDTFGNQAPFYFDNSILDIYTTMRVGATMQIIPGDVFTWPIRLFEYIEDKEINTIFWVPTALINPSKMKAFKNKNMNGKLRKILFCGEVMPNKHLNYWRSNIPDAVYANLYGPTEITDACTYYIVDRPFSDDEPLPIGIPMPNCEILVLGENDTLITPEDEGIGELCVRGTCLSKGYYKNPEKTRDAFVQNPLNDAYPEMIYRTGDMVRYNEHGELMYICRKDFQIKHFGYRIELGEIETAVSSLPDIEMNCCLYDEKRDRIVLFVEGQMEMDTIISALKEHLPSYMLPNRLICLEKMPLNANGKIDRVKLKEMI